MIVMKFGGTSVGSAERIRTTAAVVSDSTSEHPVVILSAMAGVTDRLIGAGDKAIRGLDSEVNQSLASIREMHDRTISELLVDPENGVHQNLKNHLLHCHVRLIYF